MRWVKLAKLVVVGGDDSAEGAKLIGRTGARRFGLVLIKGLSA
jgi:6-phosphofructokinase